jgi:hypothetical protein
MIFEALKRECAIFTAHMSVQAGEFKGLVVLSGQKGGSGLVFFMKLETKLER